MRTRLGILGGMFDPVHNGHIAAAHYALALLGLDRLHLVPCHIPHHRESAHASPAQRIAMLELAARHDSRLLVDPSEIRRAQVSYTVDTLTGMRRQEPGACLVFILGIDAFNSLPSWHEWQSLGKLCHLLVLARAGEEVLPATATAIDLERRQVTTPTELFAADVGKILVAQDFHNDLSSTGVREKLQQRADVTTMLDKQVIEYIYQHNLYSGHADAR